MPVIATYSKADDAYLDASLLEGNGIEVAVLDAETVNMYWMYSNAIGGVKLSVAPEDVESAREILNLPPIKSETLVCPHCGSSNTRIRELSTLSALTLLLCPFVIPRKSRTVDCRDCKQSFPLKSDSSSSEESV